MKNLSLTKKIVGLGIGITLFGAAVVGMGIVYSQKMADDYEHVGTINLPNAETLGDMRSFQKDIYINVLNWQDNKSEDSHKKAIADSVEKYEKQDAVYQSIPFVEGEAELYDKVSTGWKNYKAGFEKNLAGENVDIFPLYKALDEALNNLIAFQSNQARLWTEKAHNKQKESFIFQIFSLIILLALSLTGSILFGLSISKRVNQIVKTLGESANILTKASSDIAASSESLAQSNTEQASSLQETAASLEEITSMISKSAENANAAAESSVLSQQKAEEGKNAVDQMMNSMQEISQSNDSIMMQVDQSNKQMSEIVSVIQEIGNKTKVINDIVFQTKLLSFNASVEAARAGEHGKGFAVVAEEIGSLATMSGTAAKEISEILSGSISKVDGIVRETKQKVEALISSGKEKVESGVEVAKQCAETLNEIVHNVDQVSHLSNEISTATKEQSQGVHEINKAMSQLDAVTQQNAATSEEASSAANALSAQALALQNAIVELRSVITGSGEATDAPTTAMSSPRESSSAASYKKSETHESKKSSSFTKKSNIVAFKKPTPRPVAAPSQAATRPVEVATNVPEKVAAGDEMAPSGDHSGFDE